MKNFRGRFWNGLEWQEAVRDLKTLVKVFEEIEKLRGSLQRRQKALANQVICQECNSRFGNNRAVWVPTRTVKSCPRCSSCGRNLSVGRKIPLIECPKCGGQKCGSRNFVMAGRKDPFVEFYLPILWELEESIEKEIESIVNDHPVWVNWAQYVKGVGQTTLARIIARCDISRMDTVSKMWGHAGLGLDEEGKPQRKKKGKPLDFDDKLQSVTTVVGESLLRATDKYYDRYLIWKEKFLAQGLTRSHAHNRAFRMMRKLFLAHLWEVWRKAEGYEIRMPYAMEYLGHSTKINPEEMMSKKPVKLRRARYDQITENPRRASNITVKARRAMGCEVTGF